MTTHVVVPLDDDTVEKLRSYGIPLEEVVGRVITVLSPRVDAEILAALLRGADPKPQGVATVSLLSARGAEDLLEAVRATNRLVEKLEADVKRVEKLLRAVQQIEQQRGPPGPAARAWVPEQRKEHQR